MKDLLITICARGGSKGIPRKNIKEIGGKPLIAYSIKHAKIFAEQYGSCKISLSTDSEEIKDVAAQYGLTTDYIRPDNLATDSAGKVDAIYDLLHYEENLQGGKFKFVLDLDVSSPLRTINDLRLAFDKMKNNHGAVNIFSVSKPAHNPYFDMVELNSQGYYGLVKDELEVKSRQTSPEVYSLDASFYFYKRVFFEQNYRIAITDRSLAYEVSQMSFELDELIDFEFLNFLVEHNKNSVNELLNG